MVPPSPAVQDPPAHALLYTWIGHATGLAQFDGISILTDPVFSDRCVSGVMHGRELAQSWTFEAYRRQAVRLAFFAVLH